MPAITDRFIQLHLLTFYPPANLNRDDTGRPKTAVLGGFPRLRVSSQALKRAWRESDAFAQTLDGYLGKRTARIGALVEEHLLEKGRDAQTARRVAREIAGVFGKVKKEDDPHPTFTEQLAFVSPGEQQKALALAEARAEGADETDLAKIAPMVLAGRDTAADVAMFGRMLASHPDFNREAAVSVAHAVTTHRVLVEDDYYTAVDDLKTPADDAGAGFIGEAGFGSGVFYLYLCIDRALLLQNLDGDAGVASKALEALVTACATVGPQGKAKSFGSYARTSYMLAERGDGAPRTLASAFVQPVDRLDPQPNDVLAASIRRLDETRDRFNRAYPDDAPASSAFNVPDGLGSIREIGAFVTEGL